MTQPTEVATLLRATHQGTLRIVGQEIPCFNLENGERVISGRGITRAIGMKGRGQGITRILDFKRLKPFIDEDLEVAISSPRYFVGVGSRVTKPTPAYEATLLVQLCEMLLDAKAAGALQTEQEIRYAKYAEALLRSFAKVGIIALVDEATGYERDKRRDELQQFMDLYVAKEIRPWVQMFPDEFYEEIYRLRGWKWKSVGGRHPRFVAKLTNYIIYDRLPTPVVDRLRELNPVVRDGRRKDKNFQWLNEEYGHPTLKALLIGSMALMRGSPDWPRFVRILERSFPRPGAVRQEELPLADE